MAVNPKYGLTYKTSDGKTKTLTGINLGIGSYTSEQISAFVGIVAEVTNKTVTALDVTAANAIPPPEPRKDLIESFTISPSTLSATIGGDPVTAEIAITTSPQDASYQFRIENAPAWVSIDDTTIIFAPPAGTTPDHYLFTVIATTKDDSKEYAVSLNVEEKQKETTLTIESVSAPRKTTDHNSWSYIHTDYEITFTGPKDGRTLEIDGNIPIYTSASTSELMFKMSYSSYVYDPKEDLSSMIITMTTSWPKSVAMKTGNAYCYPNFTILESENYKGSGITSKAVKNAVSSYKLTNPKTINF